MMTFIRVWLSFLTLCSLIHAKEVRLNNKRFVIPDEMELTVAAASPLAQRPITVDFDEQGRLYVAESSGSNDPVEQQLRERPHSILRLEDSNGDGNFDRRTVFADKLMFPEGTLWHDGSLYVAAPPSIWKLTDTNDDGVADRREEWFEGKTLTGCANDLHGPYLGPDGWIYWCKGAFAEQTHQQTNGKQLVTQAAHIFRRRPEGGPLEPVMTGGMDNPVDVVFTPGGERIFTTTFFQHPGGGQRDGLIHAIYGGVYGKRHGVIDGHPRTGDLLPPLTHLGAAAPSGLVRLKSAGLGEEYRDNLLSACFNLHSITRHQLHTSGSTFHSTDTELVVCDDLDFHPTDVIEDADGSVLIIDTGGWYKLCCPTSQLKKPDVLGAIYRLRRTDQPIPTDPRGQHIAWQELSSNALADMFDDSRIVVRQRAADLLVAQGEKAIGSLIAVLSNSHNIQARQTALWALCRMPGSLAREGARLALRDSHDTVRQAAIHASSIWRDRGARPLLVDLLRNGSMSNRRAAAEALGRLGVPDVVAELSSALQGEHDRILEHSLIYAMIEIANSEQTRIGLASENTDVRRGSLIALDQMVDGILRAEDVCPLLHHDDPVMREAALFVAEHHPEWGASIADTLRGMLSGVNATHAGLTGEQLARLGNSPEVQQLFGELIESETVTLETKLSLIDSLRDSKSEFVSRTLLGLLTSREEPLVRKAINLCSLDSKAENRNEFVGRLLSIAKSDQFTDATRLAAIQSFDELDVELFEFALSKLSSEAAVEERSLSAGTITKAKLDARQLQQLAGQLSSVSPLDLAKVIQVFAKQSDEKLGLLLASALGKNPSASALPPELLESTFAGFTETVRKAAQPLFASASLSLSDRQRALDDVLATLPSGDIRRGQFLFHDQKTACFACHAVGYRGGEIGPDLSQIARIRSRRDLLESILYPSSSFVRSYEPMIVVTVSGESLSGTVRDQNQAEIVLQMDATKQQRIRTDDIEELLPGKVSLMPAGLDKQLTSQQLADLVAFLESRR